MYLRLENVIIDYKDLIGIFNKKTMQGVSDEWKEHVPIITNGLRNDEIKSFLCVQKDQKITIYASKISTNRLKSRLMEWKGCYGK